MDKNELDESTRYQVYHDLFAVLVKHNLSYPQAIELVSTFHTSLHCLIINNFKTECAELRSKTMPELQPLFGKTFEQGKLEI